MFDKVVISKRTDACRKNIIQELSPLKATLVESTVQLPNPARERNQIKD